jgi:hypothetical protein
MRAKLVSESLGKSPIYNKKEIIDFMLANQEPETIDYLRHEYENLQQDEFKDLAASIGFGPVGKYWTVLDLQKNTNESINEGSNKFRDEEIEQMANQIASIVYITYNGDDVDYEPNEEDTEEVKQIIKKNVDITKLRYVDEDADIDEPLTEDGLDVFGDEEWILNEVPEEDIESLYNAFLKSKFSNENVDDDDDEDTGVLDKRGNVINTGDHVDLDDDDEDEMDRVDREYDD